MPLDKTLLDKIDRNDPDVTSVNLEGMELTNNDISKVCRALEYNLHVTSVSLEVNKRKSLGGEQSPDVRDIAALLRKNSNLTHLEIIGRPMLGTITLETVKEIGEGLRNNNTLKSLVFVTHGWQSDHTEEAAEVRDFLADRLKDNTSITEFTIKSELGDRPFLPAITNRNKKSHGSYVSSSSSMFRERASSKSAGMSEEQTDKKETPRKPGKS